MAARGYFKCLLPDGRNIDIMTPAGADAFIGEGQPQSTYLQSNIQDVVIPTRQRLQSASSRQGRLQIEEELVRTYVLFACVADNASDQAFARIGQEQLICLISHVNQVFSKLAKDAKWTRTGVLQKYDQELLDTVIPSCKHVAFCKLALEKDLLVVLAECCASRSKTNMPCPDFTESMLSIVNNSRITLSMAGWQDEKVFKKLEATGLLAQVFRCFTQPSANPSEIRGHLNMLENIMECSVLVKKKFKPGEPTGDILANVISGTDGYKGNRNQQVMARLEDLQKMACMSSATGSPKVGKSCRKCNKASLDASFQTSLMICSRCKNTFYCSKECQASDWKVHKKTCAPLDKGMAKASEGNESAIFSWAQTNYYAIWKEIVRVTQKEKVDKQELVLEVDLYAGKNGSAPGLRNPPEFKVGLTSRYMEGSRPDEPDWFHKGTSVYKNNVKMFLSGLKDHYSRMTSKHLFVVARYPSKSSGIYRVQLQSEATGVSMYSDEALDAFSRCLRGDDSRLGQVYGASQVQAITSRRDAEMVETGMSDLAQRMRAFAATDEYRNMREEFGDSN